MDSLTQIVLGAAVGELTQGKKLGNRAMLWGAIAGTIPDLDVFVGKLYKDPVDELAFHRGISHSFFFAATFSILLSYLTYWIYDKGNYKKPWFAWTFIGILITGILAILSASNYSSIGFAGATAVCLLALFYGIYRYNKTKSGNNFTDVNIGVKGWYKLFFWAVITHPILDCFTVYGTQIFLPFSNMRVSFDNISVADPGYTIPFLLCLIIASFITRTSKYRYYFNIAGIVLSSLYMAWTFSNKSKVNSIVKKTLEAEGISYQRFMTTPTILNNVLWSTTIEADSVYYQGQYSFFDDEEKFDLVAIPKNRHLIPDGEGDHTIETLKWFSSDYYGIIRRKDGKLQINDLRFGSFSGKGKDENDFIFRFVVEKDASGAYKMNESEGGPPAGKEKEVMTMLLSRIKGKRINPITNTHKNGVVSSAHKLASDIGVNIMKQGGNAYDAAVAVNFALAVVYPRAGNLGGGGFATIRTESGTTTTLDFREKAPAKSTQDMYLDNNGEAVALRSLRGALASGVPGSVMGMKVLHDSLGTISMQSLLAPAINLAEKGYAISDNEASRLNKYRAQFVKYNKQKTVFVKEKQWQEGDLLIQPKLAATLKKLSQSGLDDFYTGETAESITSHFTDINGLISKSDLINYSAIWRKPIKCNYKGYDVWSMPPPSSGGIALCQILDGAEDFNISSLGHNSSDYGHILSEIEKRVFTVRNQLMGDPDYVEVNQDLLLSDTFTTALYKDIGDRATEAIVEGLNKNSIIMEAYETTHFSIVDSYGNAIALTTTLNGNYGSFVVVPDGGFLMNNQMDDFTAKPGIANQYGLIGSEKNAIAPGKRMLSSMSPTIITKDGKLFMVLGSPGGPTIITSVLQTFLNVVDHGMNIQEAVDAPRFHDQGYPIGIKVEKGKLSNDVLSSLRSKGHTILETNYMGAVNAVLILPSGKLAGGADNSRGKDDTASGY